MKRIFLIIFALFAFLGIAAAGTARAQYYQPESGGYLLSPEELDELLAPIALYPDPLLAQILPAATFIDQIDEAARYVRQYGAAGIDDKPWDVSVKAVAHYPDVLFMMDQKYDWTAALGQAFINQEQDVMDAIQRLRAEAEEQGNLGSTAQQEVYEEDDEIRIVPAAPDMIYIPRYDPAVIYFEPAPSFGFITFGVGFTIGAWLDRDCDWHGKRVFYHGWRGAGWISRARPLIHDRKNIYINSKIAAINVNRAVIQHDTAGFRNQLLRDARRRPARVPAPVARPQGIKPAGKPVIRHEAPRLPTGAVLPPVSAPRPSIGKVPPTVSAPRPSIGKVPPTISVPRPTIGTVPPASALRPATTVTRPAERPDITNFYRGREIRGAQPAARTGYGGYGSGRDATIYRQRGEKSLESMGRMSRPQTPPVQVQHNFAPARPSVMQPAARPAPLPARPAAPSAPRPAAPSVKGGQFRHH